MARAFLCAPLLAGPAWAQGPASGAAPASRAQAARPGFEALARRAEKARAAGMLDEAASLYRRALELKPAWVEGLWALATIHYDLDRYEAAREAFARVVAAQPDNGAARAMLGLCDFQLRAYEQALEELRRGQLLGLGGNAQLAAVVSYHVGILLTRSGQFELALEALRELAVRRAENPYLTEAFGLAVLRLPHLPDQAPVEKRELILLAGHAGMLMAHGRRSAAARARFEELARRFPDVANVRYAFGTYLVPEEPDAALEEFQRVLRREPDHVPALLQIAFEQLKRGRFQDALAPAEKAARLTPDFFAAHNALGRALLELGELERAIAALEAGARLAPDSAEMFFSLARAYQKAGRAEDAARARATFVELDRARAARSGAPAAVAKDPQPER